MTSTDGVSLQRKNFEQLANATRYYRWMVDAFRPDLGERILEVGCGTGNVTENFLDKPFIVGIDFEGEYLTTIRERFKEKANFVALSRDITRDTADLKTREIDTIVCLNVLEHIEDEARALRSMYDILQPGGRVVILVPAFKFLMSPYDALIGHHRRYTKKSLRRALEAAGFSVRRTYYFNMLGALGWLVIYKMLKRMEPGTGNVSLLERLVPMLQRIEKAIPPPFGLSVVAIGQKPGGNVPHD